MDYEKMTLKERANQCQNLYQGCEGEETPKCSDNFNDNQRCGHICCGYCTDYAGCEDRCARVWINPRLIMDDPTGRICYVVLETGQLVTGSIPCIISEMYDDNE